MWPFIAQTGMANAIVDFSPVLVLLGSGLVGMVLASAVLIAIERIRSLRPRAQVPRVETTSGPDIDREAA
jgi:hypothetical protein